MFSRIIKEVIILKTNFLEVNHDINADRNPVGIPEGLRKKHDLYQGERGNKTRQ